MYSLLRNTGRGSAFAFAWRDAGRIQVLRVISVFLVLCQCYLAADAEAHGGRRDRHGGHNNHSQGNYHFHEGPLTGRTFGSKAEALKALASLAKGDRAAHRAVPTARGKVHPILGVPVAPEVRHTVYERSEYSYPASIEQRIVIRQGGVFSPYSMRCFGDLGATDIEHIVANSEAHESGMGSRTRAERRRYATDLDNLTLAAPRLNRYEKRDKDPADWLPENNRCWYVGKYLEIKRKYGLSMDQAEADAVLTVYRTCSTFEIERPSCSGSERSE